MGSTLRYSCDLCGKEVEILSVYNYSLKQKSFFGYSDEMELCGKCASKIANAVDRAVKELKGERK